MTKLFILVKMKNDYEFEICSMINANIINQIIPVSSTLIQCYTYQTKHILTHFIFLVLKSLKLILTVFFLSFVLGYS